MSDPQNLGPVGIWQIKNMPDGLRRAIVDRAAVEKVTVAELLTRIMVAVMEVDWQVGNAVNPSATRSTLDDLTRIERVVATSIALAAAPDVPPATRKRVNRLLRENLPSPLTRVEGSKRLLLTDETMHAKANGAAADS